jgi:putative NADH-flavin reductase
MLGGARLCHVRAGRGVLLVVTTMKLTIFGANGPTGRLLTQRALDAGHDVVAFTRNPDRFPIHDDRLVVATGDVHDPSAVTAAIDGAGAVVSTLGVPFTKDDVTVYSDGARNIVAAMHATGVKRLVVVTSSALDPYPEPLGGFFFEKVLQPYVVNRLGRTLYEDMARMEAIVAASDLRWTIVRPSGLCSAPDVSAYLVAPDHVAHRFTTRIDLADCLLREAVDDLHVGAAIAVASPSASPSMLSLIWREGIRKQS